VARLRIAYEHLAAFFAAHGVKHSKIPDLPAYLPAQPAPEKPTAQTFDDWAAVFMRLAT
jgi:hypothetical protein